MLDDLSMSSLFMAVSTPNTIIASEGIVMKMVYNTSFAKVDLFCMADRWMKLEWNY
jgi:hypothetical protein